MFNIFHPLQSLTQSSKTYRLSKRFKGSEGPVNTLSFNANATLLASGGDDKAVRIWELSTGKQYQLLADPIGHWGQITCLSFIYPDAAPLTAEWLFFGTGRGMFLLYCQKRKTKDFIQILNKQIFGAGDSVESFDYDINHQQLAISSHYGHVRAYKLVDGDLATLWVKEFPETIPRAVRFRGKNIFIFALESGKITVLDAETAAEVTTKDLPSAIGNVAICPATANYLIDNMETGFDIYPPNCTTATHSFGVHMNKKYVKQGVFGEQGKVGTVMDISG